MFYKVLFEDLFKGFERKKLKKALLSINQNDSTTIPLDSWGNLIVQNTNSRCGGLKNEWQRDLDLNKFSAQCADG